MKPTLRDSVFCKDGLIKELPENFFETVLACEVKLKKGYNKDVFQELLNYYTKAIEYFESIDDPRYHHYRKSIRLLMTQPEIAKHFKKEKEHPNYKLEVKKKFDNRDKEEDANKVLTLLNEANKEEDKVTNVNGIIDQEMHTQLSAFQKRKEEKKKKKGTMTNELMASDKSGTGEKAALKQKVKIVNKSNDIKNKTDNDKNANKATNAIQSNFKTFVDEWSSLICNRLMRDTYTKLDSEYIKKENELLGSMQTHSAEIQEVELLLANNSDQTYKNQLQMNITQLQEKKKTAKDTIEAKYSNLTFVIQDFITNQLGNEAKLAIEKKFSENLINDLSVLLLKN